MNELQTEITKIMNKFFATLDPSISQRVSVAWNTFSGIEEPPQSIPAVTSQCPYMFKKGKKLGVVCNVLVKDGGGIFCAKHKTIPQVSAKTFELDLSKIENESELEEEIYLSAADDKEAVEELDEEDVEDEDEIDDEVEDNDDVDDDVDDVDEDEF
jgi:hypothetical protein